MGDSASIGEWLEAASRGDRESFDRVFTMVYDDLRHAAHRQLRGERSDHTLNTTALVNEAYLKLARLNRIEWKNRNQFLAIAVQAMRRVLVNHAVERRAAKRGGARVAVSIDEALPGSDPRDEEIVALDAALTKLEALEPRQARIVECRFIGGLTVEETADSLEISPATVKRDWAFARAWLNRELAAGR